MSCVMRVWGVDLDVHAMLTEITLPVDRVWTKGELRFGTKLHDDAGATVIVSDAEFEEFDLQAEDAQAFLHANHAALVKLAMYSGVEGVVFDFGVTTPEGKMTQSSYLSPTLMQLASSAGVGITISHYPCSDDED
ncbi:hypothetical protein [Massilia sp. CF038]|uniref:hypothetical protein n=1 Tax=Massilia sp. CF038 TaxID=1881045 RepID=UPI000920C87F|nr:hypothetical protein [Massilia sp. CF038]SHG45039.1 hypothetical protein SAMN05428948_0536 [Massilia sp. CF038]